MKRIVFLMALGALMFAGCNQDREGITVSESQLYGVWQKQGTQEYWSYREDGSGHTWDVSDGIENETDSGSVAYNWSINNGNQLRHRFSGTNIGDMVVRTYTITSISATQMEREEEIGTYRLRKIND